MVENSTPELTALILYELSNYTKSYYEILPISERDKFKKDWTKLAIKILSLSPEAQNLAVIDLIGKYEELAKELLTQPSLSRFGNKIQLLPEIRKPQPPVVVPNEVIKIRKELLLLNP